MARRSAAVSKTARVVLPTLHPGQIQAFRAWERTRRLAVRCGRRWGKTLFGETIACDGAVKSENIGIFAPDYKVLAETYAEIHDILEPVIKSASEQKGVIRTTTKGRIDFWTLENERAGRSRKYHKVLIDEAAFTKANMMSIWERSIEPTLLDYRGKALVLSNTNGVSQDNFLWQICNDKKFGFTDFHAPSSSNPYLPADELVRLEAKTHPLVFKQEYLAEFVDFSGAQFFLLEHLLVDGKPIEPPTKIDAVFATIDTAVKTGQKNDGTGVIYWGVSRHLGHPLMILDWDVVQIEGALLEVWLPTVFQNLEALALRTQARVGSLGAHIEDKASGTILLQQAVNRGWNASPINSILTAMGKDERAISVSGYVYQQQVKLTTHAYNKVVTYKEQSRNHLITQVFGYKIGVKDQVDDLLDAFCYGVALALGDSGGI